ncbi:MAG: hypothetical protein U1E65_35450 [Myxococcota bacterium]
MVGRVVAPVLLFLAFTAGRAEAQRDTELFAGTFVVGAHWSPEGVSVALSARFTWTRVDAPLPMGLDLEAQVLFPDLRLRVLPMGHLQLSEPLPSDPINRALLIERRAESLGTVQVVNGALTLGGVLELGGPEVGLGGSFGGRMQYGLLEAQLRGSWLSTTGPDVDGGLGIRIPSIWGQSIPILLH